jgi:hypothetical protein
MGLPKILQRILPESWVYSYNLKKQHKFMYASMTLEEWEAQGKPSPPPSIVKRTAMQQYGVKYNTTTFVETGTFMGDTSFYMKDYFPKVLTIELDQKLFERAVKRFKPYTNVTCYQGDSGRVLSELLNKLPKEEKCLFWLDGHFSSGITAKADLNTPVSAEIESVFKHNNHHVIFVDDARLFFDGTEDYPPFTEFEKQVLICNPTAKIEVKDDMIRITAN